MALRNDPIYRALKPVTQNVFYLDNLHDNDDLNQKMPFIVWHIVSKKPVNADNKVLIYQVTYHITLVTKKRSEALMHRLESRLNEKELPHRVISSYQNDDYSLNRVYEVQIITKGGY
jgi:hypothetical protein